MKTILDPYFWGMVFGTIAGAVIGGVVGYFVDGQRGFELGNGVLTGYLAGVFLSAFILDWIHERWWGWSRWYRFGRHGISPWRDRGR